MAVVNAGTAITKALTKLAGSLPRPQFVVWFNEIVKDILNQPRDWKFLKAGVSLTIANNQISIPANISEVESITVGAVIFTRNDQLSDKEALEIGNEVETNAEPSRGYTLDANGTITFYPALTGTATIKGETDITSDYADNAATIFPLSFENLFIIGLRMHYYDLTKDGRFGKEATLYQMEMSNMKARDNRLKPFPHYNRKGYVRG